MANLKETRGRIAAVKNTRKITSAMSRIAAARLVKAQQAAMAARPYGERLEEVVRALVGNAAECEGEAVHPLLTQRSGTGRVGVVLLTADRGLAGGFNANVNRAGLQFIRRERGGGREAIVIAVGKKGRSFLGAVQQPIARFHEAPTLVNLVERAKEVAAEVMAMFEPAAEGADPTGLPPVDTVYLAYNYFRSVLTQEPRVVQILPVRAPEPTSPDASVPVPPLFEPDRASLLGHLLPIALEAQLQQAMFNSIAGEIAARRSAMDSATDNATELISELTLKYNRERQAAITRELMEIIGGAEALKG
ncbi:MAG: ATP synthase F1 subunit gamma [Nannocystis sp.]|nr:ATP synthase F1 subunit gamma [Nannocystis sp.]MBA3549741.1 ATP synthase F1 subunit gamma [Nannocystis sp.]